MSEQVTRRTDIVYGTTDGPELLLDLFLPSRADGLRPGLVFVHGGGWRSGERQAFHWHAEQAALLGYVAATVDYRLVPAAQWPACFDDCQRAVRWLRHHADELSLDPTRLGAFGSSAGGHLVALLGTRDTREDSDTELAGLSSRVQCVVDYHGVHDFPSLVDDEMTAEYCVPLFGGALGERRQPWEDASPSRFVDGESAPMLLFHDPGDPLVPYSQSVQLATRLMEAARPVQFEPVPGAGHGFVYDPGNGWTQRTWPVALGWLARFLRPRDGES